MSKLNFFLILYYIFLFFLKELKNIYSNLVRFFKSDLEHYSFFKFFQMKFNKNINPSKSEHFQKYTFENKKIWNNKKNNKNKKKILVTSFVHAHPAYPHINSIIGKYLEEFLDCELIGFCDNYDHTSEVILRSFGINNVCYLFNRNPLIKFFYFLLTLKIFFSLKNINSFLKYKYNKIDIAKIVYDDVLRRSGQPTINTISFKLCLHFSNALYISDQYKEIIKKNKIQSIVLSETQFSPGAIIFQQSLANKISVYSKEGAVNKISIKKFSSFSERYTARDEPSKKIFKLIFTKYRKKAAKIGFINISRRLNGVLKDEDVKDGKWAHENKKYYSKSNLCKKLSWDKKKPIAIIFSHSLIDGNFCQGSRVFKDNLTWLRETLVHIKNLDDFNWLIKPHPMDWYYQFAKTTTEDEYKKIVGNKKNIRICPKDLSSISISKVVKTVVTSHGSAGIEYACLGLPVITAGRTSFSNLKINHRAMSKKKYFYYLDHLDKLSKPTKVQIDKARVAMFIYSFLNKTKNPLIPYFDNTRYVNKDKFYKDCILLIKKYSSSNDKFKNMFFSQCKNNISQTVNLEVLEKLSKNQYIHYDSEKI